MTHRENPATTHGTTWRKSSFSGAGNDCVDVLGTLGALRDTKNEHGPVLTGPVPAMVAAIKADSLSR